MSELARRVARLPSGAEAPVRLHVERLVVSGIPMTRAQSERLGAAVAAELERLARDPGWPASTAGGSMPVAVAPHVTLASDASSAAGLAALGCDIARSVYCALRNAP